MFGDEVVVGSYGLKQRFFNYVHVFVEWFDLGLKLFGRSYVL